MSELRYPNESREYREARDLLLKDEQELVDKVKAVAEQRRTLPPGGQLKEDYVFQWAKRWEGGEACDILRAIRKQKHIAALLMDVRSELGPSLSFLYITYGWV
jgi:Bacterial protein of unknown function (DUF899)